MTAWDYQKRARDRLTRDIVITACCLATAVWAVLLVAVWAICRFVSWLGGA